MILGNNNFKVTIQPSGVHLQKSIIVRELLKVLLLENRRMSTKEKK